MIVTIDPVLAVTITEQMCIGQLTQLIDHAQYIDHAPVVAGADNAKDCVKPHPESFIFWNLSSLRNFMMSGWIDLSGKNTGKLP